MKTLTEHLTQYAKYHRDRRNIATHFVGIPAIYAGVVVLLSRPVLAHAGAVPLSLMPLAALAACVFYLVLDVRFGFVMTALTALCAWGAMALGTASTGTWAAVGGGLFVGGWVFQTVGHVFEGRKPAFVDDLVGLLVGPLFVVAEAGFALGFRREVLAAIEQGAGPTRAGRSAAAVRPG